MARPVWNSRLLGVSALLGIGAMAWMLAVGPASSTAAESSAPAAVPQIAAGQPAVLAQAGPVGARPGEAGIKPGENEERGRGPGSNPGGKGPNPKDPPKQLSPEQIEDFLAVLHERDPGLEARIRKALVENPRGANETIAPHWPRFFPLIKLRHDDPALYALTLQDMRLTRQVDELPHRYRNARDPAAAEQIRAELRQALGARFDVRQKMLEARLAKMKEELDQRTQNRDKLIDDELKQRLAQATTRPDGPRKRDGDGPRPDGANPKK